MLQLALITNDHFRAQDIAAVATGFQWHVEAAIGQAQPVGWVRRLRPNVVLVDLDVPNAIGLIRDIVSAMPQVTVLALVTPQYLVELQEALMAGASSFVTFPLEPNQFTTTILRVMQETPKREVPTKRGHLVAVVGLKGGVGRTTLAVNMAVALRQRVDGDVILLEAHHGLSDLSLNLNLLSRHTLASLAQESNIDIDVLQGHLQNHASKIKVLAAPPDVSQLVELPIESWQLILNQLTTLAPYVVVDTAAVADAVLSEVLTQADDIVVVTGPDLAGLRSAVVLLQTLDSESKVHGRTHVVINRAGVRGGISEAACAKQMGEAIAVALPDDAALATFALNRGVPFVLSHPRSILSRKVQELVSKLFDVKAAPQLKRQASRKLFSFGKGRTVQETLTIAQ
ncbi:MAG: AAA family ATPase [Caldilineaceae bacterium]|nr:AAA family ATPase [Caldilineaceae bacterium]